MNSQGMFSIGGIASGLDTTGIIEKLMQLERQPVRNLQRTQDALRKTDDAWVQINTRLSSLRAAVDGVSRADRFAGLVSVTSSNTDVAAVTKTGTSATGSLDFTVSQLATAHQVGLAFASADTPLAGTALTVQVGSGDPVTVELDGVKTLADVAKELNGAKGGFTASVVQVADGDHRLILTAGKTGTENTIAVSGDAPPATELRAAQDAKVTIGSGAGAIELVRSSNTITDLVPGATVTLKKTSTEPVTVTATRDIDGGVKAVKGYVDALNSTIKALKDLTAYDPETKKSGPLQGDAEARRLLTSLGNAATAPLGVDLGNLSSAHSIGLSMDRNGLVKLDETKLRAAFEADFDAVGRLVSRTGTTTDAAATGVVGTSRTTAGTYEVNVTQAADVARITGAAYTPPNDGQPKTFRITTGGKTATVVLNTDHVNAEAAAQAIRDAMAEAGMSGLKATVVGDALQLETTRFGSAASFTVEGGSAEAPDPGDDVFGLAGTHAGVDVAGEIRAKGSDTWAALQGTGRVLKGTAASGAAEGLSVTYGGAAGGFDLTYSHGLAGGMANTLARAEGSTGLVARAREGITSQIKIYQTRIDGFDQRLATRESTLRRQFTAMEAALGQMNSQMAWLSSQISSLDGLRPPR